MREQLKSHIVAVLEGTHHLSVDDAADLLAEIAAQIEVDARIAEEEGWEPDKPHLGITEREEGSRDCAERIAAAIRNQPHDRTAIDQIIADTRAKALTWAADQLNDSHILSAAVRTGYETPEDRIAAQDRVAAAAVKSFCGAKDETESLKMALRHAEDRIEAARSRIVLVKTKIEDRAAQIDAIRARGDV